MIFFFEAFSVGSYWSKNSPSFNGLNESSNSSLFYSEWKYEGALLPCVANDKMLLLL